MLYLWIFGDNIEDNFGHTKFIIFYLVAGFAASFAQIAIAPDSLIPTLGASGAIAGVLGSYLIMFPKNRVRALLPLGFLWTTVELPAMVVLGFWIVIQVISQYTALVTTTMSEGGGVAYMAHIGGFVAGAILTFLFRQKRSSYQARDYYDR
jgi:membrane associated rhomboid family serine protease